MPNSRNGIVTAYARLWPREVFATVAPKNGGGRKKVMANALKFLDGPGVYILYRDEKPYYIGKAKKLGHRIFGHAKKTVGPYYHFWNFFSAFAVDSPRRRDELEGILIAAMPTANSAKPKLQREKMPREVRDVLRTIHEYRVRSRSN